MAACCAFPVTSYLELTWEAVRLTPSSTTSYPFFKLHDRFVSTHKKRAWLRAGFKCFAQGCLSLLRWVPLKRESPMTRWTIAVKDIRLNGRCALAKVSIVIKREQVLPTASFNPSDNSVHSSPSLCAKTLCALCIWRLAENQDTNTAHIALCHLGL